MEGASLMTRRITPAFGVPPAAGTPGLSDDQILTAAARIMSALRRTHGARRMLSPCVACGELLTARQRRGAECPMCGRHPVRE